MPRRAVEDTLRLKAELVERVAAGATICEATVALGLPGWTARYWAGRDPLLRGELDRAKAVGGFRRLRASDAPKMAAFLARVRAGERVRAVLGQPGMPSRTTYAYWKAADGAFAEAIGRLRLAHRASLAAARKAARRDYDPELADVISARLSIRGSLALALAGDPRMPCRSVVQRWRREEPRFDARIRMVQAAWRKKRGRGRPRRTACAWPLTLRIMTHVAGGGSLARASREVAGAPSSKTLYRWMRRDPEFARSIHMAYDDRDDAELAGFVAAIEGPGLDRCARQRARARAAQPRRRPGQGA